MFYHFLEQLGCLVPDIVFHTTKNRRREAAAEQKHSIYTNRMLSASKNCAGK